MNKIKNLIAICTVLSLSGCATPQPTADVPLLRYEQNLETALVAMDTVLEWEHTNQSTAPKAVSRAAVIMRSKAAKAFASANAVRLAYRKGAATGGALRKALSVVDGLLAEARKWWVPEGTAPASAISKTISEAEAIRSGAPGSWIGTATLLVELGRRVYKVVNAARDAGQRDKQWTTRESVSFTIRLADVPRQPHWLPEGGAN